jgi:DNA ligase 1
MKKIENHQAFKRDSFLEIAPKVECTGTDHLERYLQDIIDKGGEGIILRDPQEEYVPGRAKGYLKHKVNLYKKNSIIF